MSIYPLGELSPEIDPDSWIAPNATVIGQVHLAKNASIWWNATVRGDTDRIRIGENTNIQDGSVLHTDHGIQLLIGHDVTVGHLVTLHGCSIGDGSLIGIGAVILNNAVIGKNVFVVFEVLPNLGVFRRFQPGFQTRQGLRAIQLCRCTGVIVGERQVSCLANSYGERDADDARRKRIKAGSFGVHRSERCGFDLLQPKVKARPV